MRGGSIHPLERLRAPGLASAGFAVSLVWGLLLAGSLVPLGLLGGYSAACILVLVLRPRRRSRAHRAPLLLGGAAGFLSYPAWILLVVWVGSALGLAPRPHLPATLGGLGVWIPHLLLAPVFEELLYRERLLPALALRVGPAPAVLLSAAAFALPHLEPWSVLTTFLLGLFLGPLFLRTRRIESCIAIHLGLNAAALACGVPPTRWALNPAEAAAIGGFLTAMIIWRVPSPAPAASR